MWDDEGTGEMTPQRHQNEKSDLWTLVVLVVLAVVIGGVAGIVWGRSCDLDVQADVAPADAVAGRPAP